MQQIMWMTSCAKRYGQWNSFLIIALNTDHSVVSIKNCFPKTISCDCWHVCFLLIFVSGKIHLERESGRDSLHFLWLSEVRNNFTSVWVSFNCSKEYHREDHFEAVRTNLPALSLQGLLNLSTQKSRVLYISLFWKMHYFMWVCIAIWITLLKCPTDKTSQFIPVELTEYLLLFCLGDLTTLGSIENLA